MVKRAALARALALDPEVLLLDEPTSGLDPIAAGDFDELMRTLQRTLGLTVFMVTHDLDTLHSASATGSRRSTRARSSPSARWRKCAPRIIRGSRPIFAARAAARRWHKRDMETRVRFIIVGAFALAVVVGVFLFVWWIHAAGGLSHTRPLKVEFQGAASGLRPGSAVTFNGVRVGEVTADRLRPRPRRCRRTPISRSTHRRRCAPTPAWASRRRGCWERRWWRSMASAPTRRCCRTGRGLRAASTPGAAGAGARGARRHARRGRREQGAAEGRVAEHRHVRAGARPQFRQARQHRLGARELPGHGPKPPAPQFLDLSAPRDFPALAAPAGQIAVAEVTAPVAFQTQKMMSRDQARTAPISLGESQWTDATPKLIQLKLVEAFENAGLGGSVSRNFDSAQPDFQLILDLRRFEIDLGEMKRVVESPRGSSARTAGWPPRKLFRGEAPCSAGDGEAAAEGSERRVRRGRQGRGRMDGGDRRIARGRARFTLSHRETLCMSERHDHDHDRWKHDGVRVIKGDQLDSNTAADAGHAPRGRDQPRARRGAEDLGRHGEASPPTPRPASITTASSKA